MSARAAGLGVGLVFGVTLSWSGLASPEVIRDALELFHGDPGAILARIERARRRTDTVHGEVDHALSPGSQRTP